MSFNCPNCKQECRKWIAPPGDHSGEKKAQIFCEFCYERRNERPTYLHQKFPGAEAKGLTVAKAEVIANRRTCPDDKMVIIDKRTGRETQY